MSAKETDATFELYRAGQFTECLRVTDGDSSARARVVRARTFLQTDRPKEALAELGDAGAVGEVAVTAAALRSRAMGAIGNFDAVEVWWSSIKASLDEFSSAERAEVAIARGLVLIRQGRFSETRETALTIEDGAGPWYRAWRLHLLGWCEAFRSNYTESARIFMELADYTLSVPEAMDLGQVARAVLWLANLSREMFSAQRFEFVDDLVHRLPWTSDFRESLFLTRRSLAWAHALHGSEREAHRMIFELIDELPAARWRPFLYVDQAHFVQATGCAEITDPLLARAVVVAHDTMWQGAGEERLALLNLVVLVAGRDAASAASLMRLYDSIGAPLANYLALAHDRRLPAMEAHARGAILAADGDAVEAIKLLRGAYATFSDIGFSWRAASVALQLHELTSDRDWLHKAEEAVTEFPASAIAREIRRRAHGAKDARLAALSPAQRRVFELICHGKSNKEISSALDITVNTARNHVAAVLARFGVQSRAQLAAIARDSGLST